MGTLEVSSRLLTTVLVALLGFFILAIVAVGLDYGCEVSYPVPAHNSTGVMNAYSHIWCTIQLVAASLILSKTGEKSQSVANRMRAAAVSLVIIVVALGGLIGAVCSREDLRKHRLDAQAKASALIEGTSAA